jgi:GTP pyrophosphokinase
MRALGGEASIQEVEGWIERHHPGEWRASTVSTLLADLTYPGNPSSQFTTSQRFLQRVDRGRYRLRDKIPNPLYTHRFMLALGTAAQLHATQARKGTNVPYVSHLLGTCAIALEYGADEDEAIAALLHDAIEDVQQTEAARMAIGWFGEGVRAIVEGCTDADTHPKPPWRQRKEAYLAHLASADRSILLVSAADKLHNARTIVADLHRHGDAVWSRFKATREESIWYYRSLVDVFRSNPAHNRDLIEALERTVVEIELLGRETSASEPVRTSVVSPREVVIDEPALLFRISQLWSGALTPEELYDATRGYWRVGRAREQAQLAMAVADGLIREVFVIDGWHPAGTTPSSSKTHRDVPAGRWEFTGRLAPTTIRAKYVGQSVAGLFPRGSQNPVCYAGPLRRPRT